MLGCSSPTPFSLSLNTLESRLQAAVAPNSLQESCWVQGCQNPSILFCCCCSLAFYPALAHQRLFTSESRELILKNKAAVVGRCSICFGMSALYLAAAHLHRSSTDRKSLSSPIPAAPTSQCQQRGCTGSWSPPGALHSLPAVCCPARISGTAVLPAAQGASSRLCTGWPLTLASVQLSPFSGSGTQCTTRTGRARQ